MALMCLAVTTLAHCLSGRAISMFLYSCRHLTEFWGLFSDQLSDVPVQNFRNNTWKAVSIHSADDRQYKYVVRCTGEREFYDRSADQYELVNSINSADPRLLDR